jgi:hypothetical protein
MSTLVAQMTKDELIEIVETIIERKLLEILSTFDEEVNLKQAVRQKQMVKDGERGQSFDAVVQQLGLG